MDSKLTHNNYFYIENDITEDNQPQKNKNSFNQIQNDENNDDLFETDNYEKENNDLQNIDYKLENNFIQKINSNILAQRTIDFEILKDLEYCQNMPRKFQKHQGIIQIEENKQYDIIKGYEKNTFPKLFKKKPKKKK